MDPLFVRAIFKSSIYKGLYKGPIFVAFSYRDLHMSSFIECLIWNHHYKVRSIGTQFAKYIIWVIFLL